MKKKSINLSENKKYSFPGQHHNEDVIFVLRKHKLTLFGYSLNILILLSFPIIFKILITPTFFPAFLNNPYNKVFLILALIYYGFIWIMAFIIWADYYLDIWIITNQRLLDIEQIGFFNRIVSELDLKRIQDITSHVHGLLPTIFGFGSIEIQTAAEKNKFKIKSIPHPVTIRRKIIKLYKAAKENDRFIFKDKDE